MLPASWKCSAFRHCHHAQRSPTIGLGVWLKMVCDPAAVMSSAADWFPRRSPGTLERRLTRTVMMSMRMMRTTRMVMKRTMRYGTPLRQLAESACWKPAVALSESSSSCLKIPQPHGPSACQTGKIAAATILPTYMAGLRPLVTEALHHIPSPRQDEAFQNFSVNSLPPAHGGQGKLQISTRQMRMLAVG